MFKLTLLPRNSFCPGEATFQDDEWGLRLPGSGTKSLTVRTRVNVAGTPGDRMGHDTDIGLLPLQVRSSEPFTSERSNVTMLGCCVFIETSKSDNYKNCTKINRACGDALRSNRVTSAHSSPSTKAPGPGAGRRFPPHTHSLLAQRRELGHFSPPSAAPDPSMEGSKEQAGPQVVK